MMLRIYFLNEEDLKENPKINQYMWKNFKEPVTKNNEKIIFKFMIKTL